MLSVDRFLLSGEEIVFRSTNLSVNDEKGYDGYITNKRIIFIKRNKVHEMMNYLVTSLSWERKRRFGKGVLVLGLLLLFYYGLGIFLFLVWLLVKKDYLMVSGAGRQIKVGGSRGTLEQLMAEGRNQTSRAMGAPERVAVRPTPPIQPTPVSERVIIKEREIVKVKCPYCGTLVDVTLDRCAHCGAHL